MGKHFFNYITVLGSILLIIGCKAGWQPEEKERLFMQCMQSLTQFQEQDLKEEFCKCRVEKISTLLQDPTDLNYDDEEQLDEINSALDECNALLRQTNNTQLKQIFMPDCMSKIEEELKTDSSTAERICTCIWVKTNAGFLADTTTNNPLEFLALKFDSISSECKVKYGKPE